MEIGEKLRRRRLELNLSRNQLAEQIHVTPSAIANYENGVSYPKPDILVSLMIALKIDANYLYQDYLANSKIYALLGREFTPEEREAINKYRALSDYGKHLVRLIIDEEYERNRSKEWVEFPCVMPGVRKLHSGFLLQKNRQIIKLKRKYALSDMDFCFQVQVDRYEPIFKKYDILALKDAPAEHNEMGLFCLNDIYYIRTLYHVGKVRRLHSLNVIDPDIEISETDRLDCLGTILGRMNGSYELIPTDVN